MLEFLNTQPLLSLFLVITVGHFIGRLRVRSFCLDSSAILFVGLIAGHLGIELPAMFRTLGLLLFIYAIGMMAGPSFFRFLKRRGWRLNLIALAIVSTGAIVAFAGRFLLGIDADMAIGLFAGALTSTPGLASAQEATGSALTSIGYSVAYPFGVIGVILFIRLLPAMMRITAAKEKGSPADQEQPEDMTSWMVEIINPAVIGKSLQELRFREKTGCVVSRIMSQDTVTVPTGATVFHGGDVVNLVGREPDLEHAIVLLGRRTNKTIPQQGMEICRFVVTNTDILGKTLAGLGVSSYGVNITRVRRSGMDLPAGPKQHLEWGDRVTVVGSKGVMPLLKDLFGDDIKKGDQQSVYAIILGIALGILIGLIPITIAHFFSFKLGMTGGILITALILSNRGKSGPIVWRVPGPTLTFIRELGLVLFLAVVGCSAGKTFVDTIASRGVMVFAWGAVVTVLPMFVGLVMARPWRMDRSQLAGALTGGMTSTPGLAAASASGDAQVLYTYSSVYPVAMLAVMAWAKCMVWLFTLWS